MTLDLHWQPVTVRDQIYASIWYQRSNWNPKFFLQNFSNNAVVSDNNDHQCGVLFILNSLDKFDSNTVWSSCVGTVSHSLYSGISFIESISRIDIIEWSLCYARNFAYYSSTSKMLQTFKHSKCHILFLVILKLNEWTLNDVVCVHASKVMALKPIIKNHFGSSGTISLFFCALYNSQSQYSF